MLNIPEGNALPDGTYDVVATATDAAGNTASDGTTDELTIDTAAPMAPTVNSQETNDNTPVITGTADSMDDLAVQVNGVAYTEGDGDLTDNGDDSWILDIPEGDALPDGTYDVVATATDAAGNTATDGTIDELTLDTTVPMVPTVTAQETNDHTPIVKGTAESAASLTVEIQGVIYTEGDGNLTDNGNNTWTLQIPDANALHGGTYDVIATATDEIGNAVTDMTVDELVINFGAPSTNNPDQDFCAVSNPTIADIQVNENNVNWYLMASGGTVLPNNTPLTDDTVYYAALIGSNSENSKRLEVHVNIISLPTPTTFSTTQAFCSDENAIVADISVNENNVVWYDQISGGIPLAKNALLIDGTTYYGALVADGCESSIRLAVSVHIDKMMIASISSSESTTCFGTEITYTTQKGMSNYMWLPSNGGMIIAGGSSNDDYITIIWDELGTQSVSVSYEGDNACMILGEATLEVAVTLCSDLTISKQVDNLNPMIGAKITYTITVVNTGETDMNDVEVDETLPSGLSYENSRADVGTYNAVAGKWMIPTVSAGATVTLEVTVSVLEIGNYLNVASIVSSNPMDGNTDNNVAEIAINPNCLKVYNEFSPNEDGNNDRFTIRCIEKYPQNTLKVYNRAGNLVYTKTGYKNDWDGCANTGGVINKKSGLPSATYFYILELNDGSPDVTGWIYIAR